MNIIFTGGGTGGHLYPAIAVAQELRKHPNNKILFIGSSKGVEASIVPAEGFEIKFVSSSAFSLNIIKAIKGTANIISGIIQAKGIISNFKPDIVVGSGGYVSAPVTIAAFLKKIPIVLLEQNAISGKTNRLVGKMAVKICASFESSLTNFPRQKTILTGNPVRMEILNANREEARKKLGIGSDKTCVLITGASQGAQSINEAILACLEDWKHNDWVIIHITGEKHLLEIKGKAEKLLGGATLDYRPTAFMNDIAVAYAACDIAVARAGATTLSELTLRGIPAILIPYPFAAEDHQTKNAAFLENKKAAVALKDSELKTKLKDTLEGLLADDEKLKAMAEESRKLGSPDAVFKILKVLNEIK